MTHDPLCYMSEGKWGGGCQCDLISRVRADTLDKAAVRVNNHAMQIYLGEIKYDASWDALDAWNDVVRGKS